MVDKLKNHEQKFYSLKTLTKSGKNMFGFWEIRLQTIALHMKIRGPDKKHKYVVHVYIAHLILIHAHTGM